MWEGPIKCRNNGLFHLRLSWPGPLCSPDLPPPSTRERPPGCKTVFVGGLPENATEEIIREVFDQCGEIAAIRKSKKNFCHIRFSEEFMVDKAIYLSGVCPSSGPQVGASGPRRRERLAPSPFHTAFID